MTLPNTPLEEWLFSSSSLRNVGQGGGICRLLLSSPLSSRNRLPKSPPSSGLKNGEEWLQEARALPLENAPSILIKPFSGRHAAWHAGGIRVGIRVVMVPRFGARCHLCARMVTRMKFQTWPFLHVSVLQYLLQSPRTRKRRFWCQFCLALRCRAPWASLMPVTRNKPIKP